MTTSDQWAIASPGKTTGDANLIGMRPAKAMKIIIVALNTMTICGLRMDSGTQLAKPESSKQVVQEDSQYIFLTFGIVKPKEALRYRFIDVSS